MTSRDTRREGRRARRAAGRPEWGALLVLLAPLLALAGPGCGPEPTPAPTPTPTASAAQPTPGCGNGVIDPGESCDGEPFCVNCSLGIASGCCEIGTPDDGAVCIDVGIAGAQPCITVAGGRFSIGTTCAGPPCGFGDPSCHVSACTDEAIQPVSICCQRTADRCQAKVLDSSGAVSSFALLECNTTGEETALVGTCGDDGRCVPGH
jgi:hypothetical protein